MLRRRIFPAALLLAAASASGSDYPMLDMIAQNVVQKYQQATCETLWQDRGKPKTQQEQEAIQLLQGDAQMRAVFMGEVAVPIATKLFECGLIP